MQSFGIMKQLPDIVFDPNVNIRIRETVCGYFKLNPNDNIRIHETVCGYFNSIVQPLPDIAFNPKMITRQNHVES
jgi:hypothetical protein